MPIEAEEISIDEAAVKKAINVAKKVYGGEPTRDDIAKTAAAILAHGFHGHRQSDKDAIVIQPPDAMTEKIKSLSSFEAKTQFRSAIKNAILPLVEKTMLPEN